VVASLAARAYATGKDPRDSIVREALFRAAREAHGRSQGGGSGADVAAAVHGGVLNYVGRSDDASVRAVDLPSRLFWRAFWSGTSARTSNLLARVEKLRTGLASALDELSRLAVRAADAVDADDAALFVGIAREYGAALAVLGHAADAPIVPPSFARLALVADGEGGAFLPSGAGGGDVGLWLSCAPPSAAFVRSAMALSMHPLDLDVDRGGVRAQPAA
jgi:phosphomevalonate kinase